MNELVPILENPVAVFTSEQEFNTFYARIKAEVEQHVPDVSTARGRADIKSLAYKVTRTKTAIDDAGKKLNEDARKQISVVDESRRKIRAELEALADLARKPLTDWEQAEADRAQRLEEAVYHISRIATVPQDAGSNMIADRIGQLQAIEISEALFGDSSGPMKFDRDKFVADLRQRLAAALQREADQAELARLREEKLALEQAERDRIAAEERREFVRLEEAKRELERQQAEKRAKDEAERRERQKAEREAEIASQAAYAKQREMEAEMERTSRAAAAVLAKAEAEASAFKEKVVREAAAAAAKAEREQREHAAREANKAHRSRVMNAAKKAIMDCGANEDTAKKIVLAIVAKTVPNVEIRF